MRDQVKILKRLEAILSILDISNADKAMIVKACTLPPSNASKKHEAYLKWKKKKAEGKTRPYRRRAPVVLEV